MQVEINEEKSMLIIMVILLHFDYHVKNESDTMFFSTNTAVKPHYFIELPGVDGTFSLFYDTAVKPHYCTELPSIDGTFTLFVTAQSEKDSHSKNRGGKN